MDNSDNKSVYRAARSAWNEGAVFRSTRRRLKNYTYGRQWDDPEELSDGRVVTEGEAARLAGARPMTNNLLRQMVKSVVGRFRAMASEDGDSLPPEIAERNMVEELDARALEEFLISGSAIQRIVSERRPAGSGVWIDNVNPSRFFCNRYGDPRGLDLELVGMLHDMSLNEVKMRFGRGDQSRCRKLEQTFRRRVDFDPVSLADVDGETILFERPQNAGRCRLIEVWTLESRRVLRCVDPESGNRFMADGRWEGALKRANSRRVKSGRLEVAAKTDLTVRWHCRWFAPNGILIDEYDSPYRHGLHPFVVKLYPLIDGEVHPFVEDVIDQQRHINRLITLIDHVLSTSSKGGILYPVEGLVPGTTLDDIAREWSQPGAFIPYRSAGTQQKPEPLRQGGSDNGASQLLSLELRLMEQVSGVSSALQGLAGESTTRTSANLYATQAENSLAGLRDLYDTFVAFRHQRSRLAATTV